MPRTIITVVGGARVAPQVEQQAYDLGRQIALAGWILLTGGRDAGVMAAATRGAHDAGGLTVGVLPTNDRTGVSPHIDIPIVTGMGDARNVINVLTADVVVAMTGGAGTLSEIALAAKNNRPTILLNVSPETEANAWALNGNTISTKSTEETIKRIRELL